MKIFLGLLIVLPLVLRADAQLSYRQSAKIDAFFKGNYELLINGKVSEQPLIFEIHLRGTPNVPCGTQNVLPELAMISDTRQETLVFIQLHVGESHPRPGCQSQPIEIDSPWLEVRSSSGRVSFVTPENVHLDIRNVRESD